MSVVEFKLPQKKSKLEYVWQCGCGSQHFMIQDTGEVICVGCDHICTVLRVIHVPVPAA